VRLATPHILKTLSANGIPATFFFTGDAARACPEAVQAVLGAGHEVGCHTLQHESLGDPLWDAPGPLPVLPEEVEHRIALATDVLTTIAGVQPFSFRCPRGWSSNAVVRAIEHLGYGADSSYQSYYFAKQFVPFHPSAECWHEPGDLRLLEVPLSSDLTVSSADPFRRDCDLWPGLRVEGGAAFKKRIDRTAEILRSRGLPAVICHALHPWEFLPMPALLEYGEARIEMAEFLWRNTGDAHLASLDELLSLLRADGAVFWTVKDFVAAWG
jgi:peptidoglycan-N-acetylglucosamine deacetylase